MTPKILNALDISVEIAGLKLLSDISLDISVGEVVALIGPNGSGKSTFLRALVGEQSICQGQVYFDGELTESWDRRFLAQRLGVLPQQSVLSFPFTGQEVVGLARTPHNSGAQADAEIVAEVLEFLDASYLADRLYPNMSGGEQQRIQLARVLAQVWEPSQKLNEDQAAEPKLLLLDEPSSYFDLAHQQMLVELLHQVSKRNISVLVVLHDINMAMACADRVAVLSCGRLEAFGKTEEVLNTEMIESVFSVKAKFLKDPDTNKPHMVLPGAKF